MGVGQPNMLSVGLIRGVGGMRSHRERYWCRSSPSELLKLGDLLWLLPRLPPCLGDFRLVFLSILSCPLIYCCCPIRRGSPGKGEMLLCPKDAWLPCCAQSQAGSSHRAPQWGCEQRERMPEGRPGASLLSHTPLGHICWL